MTIRFDTLTFAKRLTEAGERPEVAEAHALALKEFVMENLATKDELFTVRDSLSEEIVRLRDELSKDMSSLDDSLHKDMASLENGLRKDLDTMGLKLTVRLGGMLVVAVGVLASPNRFF